MVFALGGAKHEHFAILQQLLLEALRQDRIDDAKKLYDFLEKAAIVKRDPKFTLKVGMELLYKTGSTFDTKVLRFFQEFGRKFVKEPVLILEETIKYYIRCSKLAEAYDTLVGYLSSPPYSSVERLHILAARLAAEIASREERRPLREKYTKKAISHLEDSIAIYQSSNSSYHFELQVFDIIFRLAANSAAVDLERVNLALESLIYIRSSDFLLLLRRIQDNLDLELTNELLNSIERLLCVPPCTISELVYESFRLGQVDRRNFAETLSILQKSLRLQHRARISQNPIHLEECDLLCNYIDL